MRLAIFVLLVITALAGCKGNSPPPLHVTLGALKPGAAFPDDALPSSLRGKGLVVKTALMPATSDHPMEKGGALCVAPAFWLGPASVGDAGPAEGEQHAAVYVFCGGKHHPAPDGAPGMIWKTGDAQSLTRLESYFNPAIEPELDVIRITERTKNAESLVWIVERAWRLADGKLAQVLHVVPIEPSMYATEISPEMYPKAATAIATRYASGFVGRQHPLKFVTQAVMPKGRAQLDLSWNGREYVTGPLIPMPVSPP